MIRKGQLLKMCLASDHAILLSEVDPRKIITFVQRCMYRDIYNCIVYHRKKNQKVRQKGIGHIKSSTSIQGRAM